MLVDPPIAMSTRIALASDSLVTIERGSTDASSSPYQRLASSTTSLPASRNRSRRRDAVASVEPLPGSASPTTSSRQFIELAVNIPEHEPQVGQAFSSMEVISESDTSRSTALTIASMRSRRDWTLPSSPTTTRPASIAPPETNTVGMLSRSAASSIPGVILSQLEMQTSASAWCALTMYSTESAMISRLGSE